MRKKILVGIVTGGLAIGLSGCGQSDNTYLSDIDFDSYVTLCEYKGVEADQVTYEVSDDELQDAIDEDLYEYVTYETVSDRAAQEGDCAVVTYTTTIDGEESEDYSAEEEEIIIGEGYLFTEVEEALIGMQTGESKQVDVTITEDFAYEDADVGKTASVDFELTEISEEIYPEYNDAFVQENLDYDSTEEYEEAKKQELSDSKEEEYYSVATQEIMEYLLDNSEFDGYPDELYEQCEENYNSENEYSASMYGMELSEFEELLGLDEDTKKADIETNVYSELLIGAISEAENITCSDQEITDFVDEYYEDYGYESADEFLEDYDESDVKDQIIYEKVMEFLYDNASLTEITEDEYLEQQEALYDETE